MTMHGTVSSVEVHGTRIVFCERGSGPHLVLLHGMFGDHMDWEAVIEPLSRCFHVVAVDLPGFGASGKPSILYSLEFFLETLQGLFATLQLDHIYLAGNSFGGQLAVLYALRHPAQVRKLVLVDCGGFRHIPREERDQTMHAFSENNLLSLRWTGIQYLFSQSFARSSNEKARYLERQTDRLRTPDYPAYSHAVSQSIRTSLTSYVFDRLKEIVCPTLLLWGDRDPLCPVEQGRAALKQLRNGELHILRECGHMPQLDSPREFAALLIPFLLALDAAPANAPDQLTHELI